jgi:hypothetical protein
MRLVSPPGRAADSIDRGDVMSRRRNWLFQAALLLGLGVSATAMAGEFDARPSQGGSGLLNRLFARKDKPEEKKSDEAPAKEAAKKPSPPINSPASARSRELANYLRRMAVCDQLMQVAYDTKDEELQRQVEQLRDRVWTTYQVRTEQLPAGTKKFESDEQILDKHLGAKAGKEPADEVLLGNAPSKNRSGRTAFKEDKP